MKKPVEASTNTNTASEAVFNAAPNNAAALYDSFTAPKYGTKEQSDFKPDPNHATKIQNDGINASYRANEVANAVTATPVEAAVATPAYPTVASDILGRAAKK